MGKEIKESYDFFIKDGFIDAYEKNLLVKLQNKYNDIKASIQAKEKEIKQQKKIVIKQRWAIGGSALVTLIGAAVAGVAVGYAMAYISHKIFGWMGTQIDKLYE